MAELKARLVHLIRFMDRAIALRATAAVAVAVAHAAVLWLVAMHRHAQRLGSSAPAPSILVFLPLPERVQRRRTASAPLARASARVDSSAPPPARAQRATSTDTAAITVDWSLALENAAARAVRHEDERQRQLAALRPKGSPEVDLSPPPKPAPEFGWDRSVTNRMEPLETGGTYVHINERCGIVFAIVIMPVCKLGKIPARDDLFEHMNDPIDLSEPTSAAP